MSRSALRHVYAVLFALLVLPLVSHAAPLLLLHPSLSKDQIAFRHADDIWVVARTGGEAVRLTSSASVIGGPYFSPDGQTIAYSARIRGNVDVYTIPASGGVPHRLGKDDMILMPANVPHALKAVEQFKMMLVMIREATG